KLNLKRINWKLIVGTLVLLLVSVASLVSLGFYTNHVVEGEVRQVATSQITSSTNEEANRFVTVKYIPFLQSSFVIRDVKNLQEEGTSTAEEIRNYITEKATYQELESCALISKSGTIETLAGNLLPTLSDNEYVVKTLETIRANPDYENLPLIDKGVVTDGDTLGSDGKMTKTVFFCSCLEAEMSNGETSIGLLWGRPAKLIETMLNVNTSSDSILVTFSVINQEGDYISSGNDKIFKNFLTQFRERDVADDRSVEQALEDIKSAIKNDTSLLLHVVYDNKEEGTKERRTILISNMVNSNWHLVSVLPYGALDTLMSQTNSGIIAGSIVAISLILASLAVVYTILLIDHNKKMRMIKASKEKAERLSNEIALDKERYYEAFTVVHQALKSGMWGMEFDENGKMVKVTWSEEFRKMLGFNDENDFPNTLEAWSSRLLPDQHDRVVQEFQETIDDYSGEKTYDVEYELANKAGEYRWYHAAGRLRRKPDGTPIEYVGIFIDINDKHLAEQRLQKALSEAEAANKAKSEFLSNMSHDIRTPMNGIVGMTNIAQTHIDDKERVEDCLRKIDLSSKHLLGLINDVLDMSKIESGKMVLNMEDLSLRTMMETICDIIRTQIKMKNQHFDIFINKIISEHVYLDSVRINQVLLNLLSNAMKFTSEEGTITISLNQEESPKGEKYVRTHIYVKDNGIGMSKEFQEKLFTAFEREDNLRIQKTQGTGLGMAITKHIIDAMGGTIDFESELGSGTTFHITLDLEKVERDEAKMKLPNKKILVVDDNDDILLAASEAIKELDAIPDTCHSGKEAVEKAKNNDYFAILVDYKMPGMDGISTIKALRDVLGDKLPISLISAYDWNDFEEEAKNAGATGFISKPLFKSTIYHELVKYMEDYEGEAKETKDHIDLKGLKFILAEDQYINAEIMSCLLIERGAEVDVAEDGKQAVSLFEKSEEKHYDAILMDLRMPNMNGFEATEAIRKMKRHDAKSIPIIALTADAFAEDAKKCLEVGMDAHLTKPIDIDVLEKTLAKFLL
nr:response regulator [Bacilli bacterium]